jgi:hypothetical protein
VGRDSHSKKELNDKLSEKERKHGVKKGLKRLGSKKIQSFGQLRSQYSRDDE